MPSYTVHDPATGKVVTLKGESAPSEQELHDVFSQLGGAPGPGGQPNPPAPDDGRPAPSLYREPDKLSRYGYRPILETGGMMASGTLAAPVAAAAATIPVAGGPLALAVEGAAGGLGYSAGGAAADAIDKMRGMTSPAMDPAKTLMGRAATGAVMGPLASVAGQTAKALTNPLADELTRDLMNTTGKVAAKYGIPMTAAQLSGSATLSRLESMLAKLPFSSDVMSKFYKTQLDKIGTALEGMTQRGMNPALVNQAQRDAVDALHGGIDDMVRKATESSSTSLPEETIGRNTAAALSQRTKELMDQFRPRYQELPTLLPPEAKAVPLTRTAAQVAKLQAEQGGTLPSLQSPKLQTILRDFSPQAPGIPEEWRAGDPQLQAALAEQLQRQAGAPAPMSMDIESLLRNRSALSDAIVQHNAALRGPNPGTKFVQDKTGGALSSVLNAMDEDLADHAKAVGGPFKAAYDQLQADYGATARTVNTKYVQNILNTQSPAKVIDLVFQPGHAQDLQQLYSHLPADQADTLTAALTRRLTQPASGTFNPVAMEKEMNALGPDVLGVAYQRHPETLEALRGLAHFQPGAPLPVQNPEFRNLVVRMTKMNPDAVASAVMQPNFGGNVNRLRAVMGEDGFGKLQDAVVYHLTHDSSGNADLVNLGKKYGEVGDNTMQALLPPEKLSALADMQKIGHSMGIAQSIGKNPSGTAQVAGMMGLAFKLFNNPLSVIKFLVALPELAHGYLSKPFEGYLQKGIVGPRVAQAVGQGAAGYAGSVVGDNLNETIQRENQ